MKRFSKVLAMGLSVVLLTFAGGAKAEAAETAAPFTADQLLAVVNAQCAGLTSVRQVVAESVQLTDTSTGITVEANLSADIQQNRTVRHITMAMNLSLAGYTQAASQELYAALDGKYLNTYTLESGEWEMERQALSSSSLAGMMQPFTLNGIDTTGSAVTTDGLVYTFAAAVDSDYMANYTDMFESAGLIVRDAAFPVILEIDAKTMLPKSMIVQMSGLTMESMPEMAASVTAVVTFDGFNQYDALAVPAEVIRSAA